MRLSYKKTYAPYVWEKPECPYKGGRWVLAPRICVGFIRSPQKPSHHTVREDLVLRKLTLDQNGLAVLFS